MSSSTPQATPEQVNALVERYYGTLGSVGYADPLPLDPGNTVLVLVDAQEHLTPRAVRASLSAAGLYSDDIEPVIAAIAESLDATLSNIGQVLTASRAAGIRVLHVGIQAMLPGAEDTGALHQAAGMLYPPGSIDAAFLPEAAPVDGEIVLTKTCSGVHVGTHIDQALRNLGVSRVLIAGFYTDQCISSSVRDLADLGYQVSLIEDAIGAMSPQRHEYAMQSIRKLYANSETTEQLLPRLEQVAAARAEVPPSAGTGRHR